ncbi:T9SS type A sorting domain-containing protein [candidate division WOR-3 bacterium]|nr:T9SS type A sorting domain-containing protein [candidate division WOR-3 bacterium]
MRKFILFSIFIILLISYASSRVYLLPSINGKKSEIIPVNSSINLKETQDRKELINTKGAYQWLEYTGGGTSANLTGIEDIDTFLVWFDPPAACSVIKYEVTNKAYCDPNQNQFTMFLGSDVKISEDPYHGWVDVRIRYVIQTKDTFAYNLDTAWSIVEDSLIPIYNNRRKTFCVGWVKALGDSSPNSYIYAGGSPPYHSLIHHDIGDDPHWYFCWHFFRMRALVNFYENPPPGTVKPENLPDTYNQGPRTVNIYATDQGVPADSSGIEELVIKFQVNIGSTEEVTATFFSGDSTNGYWRAHLPGRLSGDTVKYWAVATDYQGRSDTSSVKSYIIREGNPGNFLFVDNDYTVSGILPDYWIDTCDIWYYNSYGPPDSSVIAFYNTVVWRDWGCTALGRGADYGLDIYYSDSTWIKELLNRGGNFWLSDQDQGFGLGICPDYGQYGVPSGHWAIKYLGIKGMYDDNPLLANSYVTALGDSMDTVIGDLFCGIGYQNIGEVYIAPYYYLTGNFNYSYTGSFDSIQTGAVPNMFDYNGLIISYRYIGLSETYKVYNDFFPWDCIAKPDSPDILDLVAIDSLVSDVLNWFGYTSGVSDRTLEPEKVLKLLPISIITNEVMIHFYLPEKRMINLSIYDNTGRLIRNLKKGIAPAGLNSIRWDRKDSYGNKVASGVYFYQLIYNNKKLTNKMVVIQ